jgi:hypothetical protein
MELRANATAFRVDDRSTDDPRNVGHLTDADDERFGTGDVDITSDLRVDGVVDAVFILEPAVTPLFGEPAEAGRRTA